MVFILFCEAGIAMFETEYDSWVEEQSRQNEELRNALQTNASYIQLQLLVESSLNQYSNLFRMKAEAAKADVFYLISGTWKAPVERLFLWIGGYRPSQLLNVHTLILIFYGSLFVLCRDLFIINNSIFTVKKKELWKH
jgi:hypothetical protein